MDTLRRAEAVHVPASEQRQHIVVAGHRPVTRRIDDRPVSGEGPALARATRVWLGIVVVTVLGIIMPVALIIQEPDGGRGQAWIAAAGVMVLAAIRLAQLSAVGDIRLLEFVFWVYVYVFLGLAAAVELRSNTEATTTPGVPTDYDGPTMLAVIVGVVAFMVGIVIARASRGKAKTAKPPAEIDMRRAAVLFVFGLLFCAYYVSQVGPASLFESRNAFIDYRQATFQDQANASIAAALATYPLVVATLAMASWRSRNAGPRRWSRQFATLGAFVVLITVNPINSARYVFGSVWGSYLGSVGAFRTRVRTTMTMLGIILGLLFLFPIADAFRYGTTVSVNRASFFGEYEYNGDYDSVWQIANSLAYIDQDGITWGRQLLGVLLFWVPRSIWADKPTDTGIFLANFRGYNFTNLSAPLWSEALINFGWIGLVVVFLLVGLIVGKADIGAGRALNTGKWSAIPFAAGSFYLLILLRGSLLQATGGFVVMLLCSLFVRKRPQPAPAEHQQVEQSGVIDDYRVREVNGKNISTESDALTM
jgi:hypothetical protein